MAKVFIYSDENENVKIAELCKGQDVDKVDFVSAKNALVTKARISKADYIDCVEAGGCSPDNAEHLSNLSTRLSVSPANVTILGANEYIEFLSSKLNMHCRVPFSEESAALRELPHFSVGRSRNYKYDAYPEIYGLGEYAAPLGSHPAKTDCGMLDLEAVDYDLNSEKISKSSNSKQTYNLRMLCFHNDLK